MEPTTSADAESVVREGLEVEPVPEASPAAAVEPIADADPAAEPVAADPVATKVSTADAESVADNEPFGEPEPIRDTDPVADAKPSVEAEPFAEPELDADAAPVAEPELVAEPEPAAGLEPVDDTASAAEAEPLALAETAVVDPAMAEPGEGGEPAPVAPHEDPTPPDVRPDEVPPLEVEPDPEPAAETGRAAVSGPAAMADGEAVHAVAPAPDTDVPALALRGVSKSFGELRAVDAIDLTVPAGSFYGLVGPNGAGKTTTLSIIAGLLRADRGTVSINGVDATGKPGAAKKMLGVLPDRLRTFDRLTGRQLLHYYGVLRGLPAPLVESRTNDLARAFDLVEALARPVSDYSAGMTKKVMLAGAMIHSPRLLVLDEPFEAVDPVSSAVILDILGAYVAHGGTVILSSHGMELVERVCTRVAVIVAGQVLAEGTVDEVRGEATLEQRFLQLAGGLSDVEGLEWLHTFSD